MTRTSYAFPSKFNFYLLVVIATVLTHSQGHVLEFTVEPVDTVVIAGHSAVLDCVVKSTYQLAVLIQWLDQESQVVTFSNDPHRSQLTNGSLYISSVTDEPKLTGTYQCKATVANVGSILSRVAKLTIANLMGFQDEPQDLTVFSRQKAYFACKIQAIPPPRIKWLKDERPFLIDELRMSLLPSGALEIDQVLESDQGTYRCNASSLSSHRLSNKATLIVDTDHELAAHPTSPVFIAQPRSKTVVEKQNISLDCAANGNPKPKVTWLKDGAPLDLNDLDTRYSIIGLTTSLRITNIQEVDAGTYQCRAENREDSLDASATIEVQVPPKFLIKPADIVDLENRDIELKCSVHGVPPPKVQWFKNGELLGFNDYYKIVNGHNLKIMGLVLNDSGIFQCAASNTAGNIQASASLKVTKLERKTKHKGAFKKQPIEHVNKPFDKSQSIALFSSLKSERTGKLGEVDFGHFATRSTLKSNDSNNNLNINLRSSYDPHSAFTSLKSSEINDRTNINLGDIQSAYLPPTPTPFLDDRSMSEGESPTIGPPRDVKAILVKPRFIILSWSPPAINGDNVETYSVYYHEEGSERERVQNTTRSKFEQINIASLSPGRVYYFKVVAIDSNGRGVPSDVLVVTTLSEENVPSPPLSFEAYATSSISIHCQWLPPEVPIGIIKYYTVFYMQSSSAIEHHFDTADLQYDFTNLAINTEYTLWVVAVNEHGAGASSDEKQVTTFSAAPSEPPTNISVEAGVTSLTVRWEPPPKEFQNGIITGYKIRLRKDSQKKAHTMTASASARLFVFNDLEKQTVYQVRLWAMNVNGTSPPTEWFSERTSESVLDESTVPDKPGPINVRPTSDKLYVVWTPPSNQNIRIRNYIIGWGKGIPDMFNQELDEKSRSYLIERLEPNSEYVLSLRASNEIGAGPPVYATIRTQEEPPPEPQQPLIPPVGLKALVISTTSVVLFWTDTTLSKTQFVRDNRYYVVKYTADDSFGKTRYKNVSDLNVMIDDLKPGTLYEFSVKLVKGYKESSWSMVVTNTTWDNAPSAAPRDLNVHHIGDESQLVEVSWKSPKTMTTNRLITGYVILYTDDKSRSDREWLVHAIKGDKNATIVPDLKPLTEYVFKVQARNNRGYGPFSDIVSFKTGPNVGSAVSTKGQNLDSKSLFSGNILLYLIIGGCILALTTIVIVVLVLCCRKRENTATPDRSKKGYQKSVQGGVKPPDLWIHHEQMELKNVEKGHSHDTASSSGAMTLPRSVVGTEYDNHENIHSSSLDKRSYVPGYAAIATPVNTTMSQSSCDSAPSNRPSYPRTQYSMPRAHVSLDVGMATTPVVESPYIAHSTSAHISNYETAPYISQPPPVAHVPPGNAYAPGMSVLAESQGGKRLQGQGHPLKSFTVPAPPPISTPISQPQVAVRPTCSPFKKAMSSSSSTLSGTPPSRISASNPPPHTTEEIQKLKPSHSTEELNQEMANLEGLMLTLNAITANEFEC